MRRRAVILASAASATAILGGWQLGLLGTPSAPVAETTTQTVGGSSGSSGASSGSGTSGSSDTGSSGSTDAATSAPSTGSGTDANTGTSTDTNAAASTDGTYSGSSVGTRFGDVQVQVTISGGAITDVTPLQLTDHDGRSVSISNRAAPILRDEVLQSQSASVSFVSGATYTSDAYVRSLQAALDAAGF